MTVGAFSISLSVKDLSTSRQFYENLGFTAFGGSDAQHYLIMKNGNALIGLFQGMFQGNILTFNPGWDENAQKLEKFDDVREIQRQLLSKNIQLDSQVEANTSGPASIVLKDPDGNVILFDQHV
jgi:catechol 2,3-dioxygenase-like lactoylglutathione lyase family enzyme